MANLETASETRMSEEVPVLLLKTKSAPNDGYEEYFSSPGNKHGFAPLFVPVLEHTLFDKGLDVVRQLLREKQIAAVGGAKYGGLIFTSQRAVEAFAKLVDEGREQTSWPHLQDVPVYTVGPATSRALKSISQTPSLHIFGAETGNGEALAHHILDHYGEWYKHRPSKPPLLFLVGEQRRDIIPTTLMSSSLPADRYIRVDELVVYGTGVMQSFEGDFATAIATPSGRQKDGGGEGEDVEEEEVAATTWVVVFSPTGCEAMLRVLDMLDAGTGRVKTGERGGGCGKRRGKRQTYVATIGPTTRDFLRKKFGYEPDVCAEKPSPEGLGRAIEGYMDRMSREAC